MIFDKFYAPGFHEHGGIDEDEATCEIWSDVSDFDGDIGAVVEADEGGVFEIKGICEIEDCLGKGERREKSCFRFLSEQTGHFE